jgi:hypothetical protein
MSTLIEIGEGEHSPLVGEDRRQDIITRVMLGWQLREMFPNTKIHAKSPWALLEALPQNRGKNSVIILGIWKRRTIRPGDVRCIKSGFCTPCIEQNYFCLSLAI